MLSLFACIDVLFIEYGYLHQYCIYYTPIIYLLYLSYIYALLNTLIKRYLT